MKKLIIVSVVVGFCFSAHAQTRGVAPSGIPGTNNLPSFPSNTNPQSEIGTSATPSNNPNRVDNTGTPEPQQMEQTTGSTSGGS